MNEDCSYFELFCSSECHLLTQTDLNDLIKDWNVKKKETSRFVGFHIKQLK